MMPATSADLALKLDELKTLQGSLKDAQAQLALSKQDAATSRVEAQRLHTSFDNMQRTHAEVSSQLRVCIAESEERLSSLRAKDEILETLREQVTSQVRYELQGCFTSRCTG
jgi:predicted  nucleic acid-binding Zn-ribbon protein